MSSRHRWFYLFLILLFLATGCEQRATPSSQQAGGPLQPTPYPPPPTIPTRTPEPSSAPAPTVIWPTLTPMPTPVQPTPYAPGEALPATFPSLVYAVQHSNGQPVQIWKLRYDQGLLLEELLFNLTDQTLDAYLGQDHPVGLGYGFVTKLSSSPDGQYTALTLGGEQGTIGTLFFGPDSRINFPLMPNGEGADFLAWFPDSRHFVVRDASYDIWGVMIVDSNELVQAPGKYVQDAVVSPDSRWILFSAATTKDLGKGTINSDTSVSVQQFASLPGYEMPIFNLALSPDGQFCAFTWTDYNNTWGAGQIGIIKTDGTDQRPLGSSKTFDLGLGWSPAGREIAFVRQENPEVLNSRIYPPDLVSSLWLLDVESGQERRLLSSEGQYAHWSPRWLPDGSGLIFLSDRGGAANIWFVRPDGSGLQQLTFQGGLTGEISLLSR